jgi:hypothetical protein
MIAEPNNMKGDESCAGANATQTFKGAFGWSDESCSVEAPFICKVLAPSGKLPGQRHTLCVQVCHHSDPTLLAYEDGA